jgi:hypothetical protein
MKREGRALISKNEISGEGGYDSGALRSNCETFGQV